MTPPGRRRRERELALAVTPTESNADPRRTTPRHRAVARASTGSTHAGSTPSIPAHHAGLNSTTAHPRPSITPTSITTAGGTSPPDRANTRSANATAGTDPVTARVPGTNSFHVGRPKLRYGDHAATRPSSTKQRNSACHSTSSATTTGKSSAGGRGTRIVRASA